MKCCAKWNFYLYAQMFDHCSQGITLQLFKSYSLVFYCPILRTNFKSCSYDKLHVAFHNTHRKLLDYTRRHSSKTVQLLIASSVLFFLDAGRIYLLSFLWVARGRCPLDGIRVNTWMLKIVCNVAWKKRAYIL